MLFGSTCLSDFVCCSVISSCGSRLLWGLCGSLLAFPCLRVGALLACGVYSASSLRSLQSRLPFVVSPPFLVSVCPHLLLWGGGLVTGLWPLLLLLCVGLLWGVCCTVLSPWPIVAPSPSVVSCLGFFLWRLFRLGLVGCGPALVPAFFWGGTLLPLSWLFLLGGSYSLVV